MSEKKSKDGVSSKSKQKSEKDSHKKKEKKKEKEDHPDATYIKREDIGQVIAKGMAVLYLTQPKSPVEFLA